MFAEIIELLKVVAWPIVAIILIFIIRPHIKSLLSGAKITFTVGGQKIETTLPEFTQIVEEQTGEPLTEIQVKYLSNLFSRGSKLYESGIEESEERKMLRPLRNAGIIFTISRNSILREVKAIELSPLGRVFLRAKFKYL